MTWRWSRSKRRASRGSARPSSPLRSAGRRLRSLRAGTRSFVNITPWPMKTSSSIVTPSQMKCAKRSCSARRSRALLDLHERADLGVVADRASVKIDQGWMRNVYVPSEANGVRDGHWLKLIWLVIKRRAGAWRSGGTLVNHHAISSARNHRFPTVRRQTSVTRANISHTAVAPRSDSAQKQ